MLINEQTKIAALLKQHPDALEAIVSLAPEFKKLRNPVLRRLMAGRTSIGMAAKIGGCMPADFFRVLGPLGFEADTGQAFSEVNVPVQEPVFGFLRQVKPWQLVVFDVRPILAGGSDPLKFIQQAVKELRQGQVLLIRNTFEPTPLILLLKKQGFEAFVDRVSGSLIETYFYKASDLPDDLPEVETSATDGWDELLRRFKGNLVEIDVRHLEMPQPMMSVLDALGKLPDNHALYVYHKRIPLFLLTELKERQFDYRIREVKDGEVYLLIFKSE